MCSHNTINDEEEKFVSLDKTFVDEEDGRSGPSEVLLSKDKAFPYTKRIYRSLFTVFKMKSP